MMNRKCLLSTAAVLLLISACKDLPEASFAISDTNAHVGDTIYFQSTCKGAESVSWDFGDGMISSESYTWHIYWEEDTYTVRLTASNEDGSDEATETVRIYPPAGDEIQLVLHSPSLEGNFLGDLPDRHVTIYLPPDYSYSNEKRYPVIYFLHGFTQSDRTWFGGSQVVTVNFKSMMDELINSGVIQPMILVSANSNNIYDGSYYTNSYVTGNWEDFIVKDLIKYVDTHYRTLSNRESRGIAGHSMGGYGTIKLSMRHPSLFSAAYTLSPANLANQEILMGPMNEYLMAAVMAESLDELVWQARTAVAQAAAFAPDSALPPFFGQFPVDENGDLIDSVWEIWLVHDPCTMIPLYKDSMEKLDAFRFDCGTEDLLYHSNILFDE